jgi:hypothetical protein
MRHERADGRKDTPAHGRIKSRGKPRDIRGEAAMTDLPSRRDVERALRDCGLSVRQSKRFIAVGWSALVGEEQAEQEELIERLEGLANSLRNDKDRGTIAAVPPFDDERPEPEGSKSEPVRDERRVTARSPGEASRACSGTSPPASLTTISDCE